jgi:hypothetical protein
MWFLHFQRQKHATIPARNTIPRIPPTRTGVEKKEELDATGDRASCGKEMERRDGNFCGRQLITQTLLSEA